MYTIDNTLIVLFPLTVIQLFKLWTWAKSTLFNFHSKTKKTMKYYTNNYPKVYRQFFTPKRYLVHPMFLRHQSDAVALIIAAAGGGSGDGSSICSSTSIFLTPSLSLFCRSTERDSNSPASVRMYLFLHVCSLFLAITASLYLRMFFAINCHVYILHANVIHCVELDFSSSCP